MPLSARARASMGLAPAWSLARHAPLPHPRHRAYASNTRGGLSKLSKSLPETAYAQFGAGVLDRRHSPDGADGLRVQVSHHRGPLSRVPEAHGPCGEARGRGHQALCGRGGLRGRRVEPHKRRRRMRSTLAATRWSGSVPRLRTLTALASRYGIPRRSARAEHKPTRGGDACGRSRLVVGLCVLAATWAIPGCDAPRPAVQTSYPTQSAAARRVASFTAEPSATVPPTSGATSAVASASAAPRTSIAPATPLFPSPMVNVPAGSFVMGCPRLAAATCRIDESPAHRVTLSAYAIDVFEVTVGEYQACIHAGACSYRQHGVGELPDPSFDICREQFHSGAWRHPVVCVSAYQAADYCHWQHKRLPTEAEWERAARGDDARLHPWGDTSPTPDLACIDPLGPCDVGQHPRGASPFGIQDMAGNAAEWVSDFYHPKYYSMSPTQAPTGFRDLLPVELQICQDARCTVARGGSWRDGADALRSTARATGAATGDPWWSRTVGFRCASNDTGH